MKPLTFAVLILLLVSPAPCQTLNGLTTECGKKCTGEFSVTNNQVVPMVLTIDPFLMFAKGSPDFTYQGVPFSRLQGQADLELSSTSARLAPQQTYVIDFRLRCHQVPCAIALASTLTPVKSIAFTPRVTLLHFVYQCNREKRCRLDTLRSAGL